MFKWNISMYAQKYVLPPYVYLDFTPGPVIIIYNCIDNTLCVQREITVCVCVCVRSFAADTAHAVI